MSVIIVMLPVVYLAPLAVAAAAAIAKKLEDRAEAHEILQVETRMKNVDLVVSAIETIGMETQVSPGSIEGRNGDLVLLMSRNQDGLWVGQFNSGTSIEEATSVLSSIDLEYGRLVQSAILEKLESRIEESNFKKIAQQVNDDLSVTVTLEVQG
jgi:hypothetical protein